MAEGRSFLTSLTGIITALAGLITAVAGLIYAVNEWMLPKEAAPAAAATVVTAPATTSAVGQAPEKTTEGWFIIGHVEDGKYDVTALLVTTDAPAIGSDYIATETFRLVNKRLDQLADGEQVVTLGKVAKGDTVMVTDIFVPAPSTRRQPVWAKLEAVLGSFN